MTDALAAYRSVQVGWYLRIVSSIAVAIMFAPGALRSYASGDGGGAALYFVLLSLGLVATVLFTTMTIEVDRDTVRWWYGVVQLGSLARVLLESAEAVDVSFLVGTGRTTRGRYFAVAAGSAIAIRSGGYETTLGTADPDGLLAALALPETA